VENRRKIDERGHIHFRKEIDQKTAKGMGRERMGPTEGKKKKETL